MAAILQLTTGQVYLVNWQGLVTGGSLTLTGDLTVGGNIIGGSTDTISASKLTLTDNAIGTTSTDALILQNTTAATAGVPVQMSPRSKWSGAAYNSVSTLSETDFWVAEVLPATVAGTTTAAWRLGSSIAGGGINYNLTVNSNGAVTVPLGSLSVSGGSLFLSSGGAIGFLGGRAQILSPADAQFNFDNNAASSGIGFDVSTDSLVKIRTRAQSGDGNLSAGGLIVNAGVASLGGVTSCGRVVKNVTGIANGTGTATFTVTIPNAAHSAGITVTLVGALGAGGAIGADEATGTAAYDIAVTRTAGVNATAIISTIYGSAVTSVSGGATITVAAALSAISGAVGATNTFTVNVTISHGTGSSTNHTCVCIADIVNANASGITIG